MPRKPSTALVLRELTDKADLPAMYPLVRQANPKMTRARFTKLLTSMREANYRCVGAYKGETLVGLAGFWVGWRFWCGKYIDIDNVVVDAKHRKSGIGKKLVGWVEKEARRLKCEIAVLDSYTHNYPSHRFYFREGYVILGYHFTKDL